MQNLRSYEQLRGLTCSLFFLKEPLKFHQCNAICGRAGGRSALSTVSVQERERETRWCEGRAIASSTHSPLPAFMPLSSSSTFSSSSPLVSGGSIPSPRAHRSSDSASIPRSAPAAPPSPGSHTSPKEALLTVYDDEELTFRWKVLTRCFLFFLSSHPPPVLTDWYILRLSWSLSGILFYLF